jgi:hypothetical protein
MEDGRRSRQDSVGGRGLYRKAPVVDSLAFLAFLIALLFLLSSAGATIASPSTVHPSSGGSVVSSPIPVASIARADPKILASCHIGAGAETDAYDPADGYVYVTLGASISIVKPVCTVVKTVYLSGGSLPYGIAYDPVTKEIVATGFNGFGFAFVLQGTSLVKTVRLGDNCPNLDAWDSAVEAMLIADYCPSGFGGPGGVTLLYLVEVAGVTHATVILDAFDQGNDLNAILVDDGYVFSAGNNVDVFNDQTLAFIGSFAVSVGTFDFDTLTWDPLNDTVVLGVLTGQQSSHSVLFLNADSIQSAKFTFKYFVTHDILRYGAGGVAYSPATHSVYFAAFLGNDVWELTKSGELTHVYLGPNATPQGMTYDPSNQDLYVCGPGTSMLYVIH